MNKEFYQKFTDNLFDEITRFQDKWFKGMDNIYPNDININSVVIYPFGEDIRSFSKEYFKSMGFFEFNSEGVSWTLRHAQGELSYSGIFKYEWFEIGDEEVDDILFKEIEKRKGFILRELHRMYQIENDKITKLLEAINKLDINKHER